MTPSGNSSDLLWEAFRYLQGELDAGGAANFEAKLASDLDAAEALADAVLLCEAVQACEADSVRPQLQRSSGSLRRRAFGVMAATTAAVLLLALVSFRGGANRPNPVPAAMAQDLGPEPSLLSVWTMLSEAASASREEALAESQDLDPDQSSAVPDWMFTALAAGAPSAVSDGMHPGDDAQEEPL